MKTISLKNRHLLRIVVRRWNALPCHPLGSAEANALAEQFPENEAPYRLNVIKRALVASYEDPTPPDAIIDVLADLRHLCDALGLDFAELDKSAARHYLEERVNNAPISEGKILVQESPCG